MATVELAAAPSDGSGPNDAASQGATATSFDRTRITTALTRFDAGYDAMWKAQHAAFPHLPDLNIAYENLSYDIEVPQAQYDKPNFIKALGSTLFGCFRRSKTQKLQVLAPASGVLHHGTMTLVLAPPGHGKSSYLKALAGKLRHLSAVKGAVYYNGFNINRRGAFPAQPEKLVGHVDQVDIHAAHLTVRETFELAHNCVNVGAAELPSEDLKKLHDRRVDTMIRMLGLDECAETIVGDDLVRGVSGGQKKRVTLGEMILGQTRAMMLDEVSTGLDASTTLDIFTNMRSWARHTGGLVAAALLQPTPETFELFDNIVVLREGHVIYHGPRTEMAPYFAGIGVPFPGDMDPADFLVEFISNPMAVYHSRLRKALRAHRDAARVEAAAEAQALEDQPERAKSAEGQLEEVAAAAPVASAAAAEEEEEEEEDNDEEKEEEAAKQGESAAADVTIASVEEAEKKESGKHLDELQRYGGDKAPLTTTKLAAAFARSELQAGLLREIEREKADNRLAKATEVELNHNNYGNLFSRSFFTLLGLNVARQAKLTLRNKQFIGARLGQAVVMGAIMGSLYFDIQPDELANRLGISLFALIFLAFSSMVETQFVVETKFAVMKQTMAGFYPESAYSVAAMVVHLPLATLETLIFGSIVYFMAGFEAAASRYLFFLAIVLLNGMCWSVAFRLVAFYAPNFALAQVLVGPITAVSLLFAGFIITQDNIWDGAIWLYWITPFSWALRALAISSFEDTPGGLEFLETAFQFSTDSFWKWSAVVVLLGIYFIVGTAGGLVLYATRRDKNMGTSRSVEDEEELKRLESDLAELHQHLAAVVADHSTPTPGAAAGAKGGEAQPAAALATPGASRLEQVRLSSTGGLAQFSLPCDRITLSFRDLSYAVEVPTADGKGKYWRSLLNGVSGYARPMQVTALMGASGAGKTTLMDVIAGRKTGGRLGGEIFVNGQPKNDAQFKRLVGYVEQNDLHLAYMTVRESLQFAARLRLAASVAPKQRAAFVEEVLEVLELKEIAERIVGTPGQVNALSPGQRKRLTIGVELVANPAVLFLDEPTSGLDSRAAAVVMRVIRNIGNRGRTVVCTIHQPSADLFYQFDQLLLLRKGGHEVFFGPIDDAERVAMGGRRALRLIDFLESVPGTHPCPARMNPASWMLDCLNAAEASRARAQQAEAAAKGAAAAGGGDPEAGAAGAGLPIDYVEAFKAHELHQTMTDDIDRNLRNSTARDNQAAISISGAYAQSFAVQFGALLQRTLVSYWRNTDYNFLRFFVAACVAVIFGLVFFQIDLVDAAAVQSSAGAVLMMTAFPGVINYAIALGVFARQRPVLYRELSSSTFSSPAYSLTQILAEVPFVFVNALVTSAISYFLIGFELQFDSFVMFVVICFLLSMVMVMVAMFLVSLMPNEKVATVLGSVFLSLFFQFGGLFIPRNTMPKGWLWFFAIDPFAHAMQGIAEGQYRFSRPIEAFNPAVFQDPSAPPTISMPLNVYFESRYGLPVDAFWESVGWLGLTLVILATGVVITQQFVRHIVR